MRLRCDSIGCRNIATWKQGYYNPKPHIDIVYMCEAHHAILRNKLSSNFSVDSKVIEWVLHQPPNQHKVTKYGIYIIGVRAVKGI